MLNLFQHLFIRYKDVKRQRCEANLEGRKLRRYEGRLLTLTNPFLPLLGKDKRMGNNQYPPQPSRIREGVSCHCEGATHVDLPVSQRKYVFTLAKATTHVALPNHQRQCAFTLAEVLITLGIIGVVVAMTMPVLIAKHQKDVTLNRLKKTYSVLNQAFKLSEYYNDEYAYWEKKDDIGANAFFNKYWKPYLNGADVCLTYQECGYSENFPWQTRTGARKQEVAVVDNSDDNRISFFINDGTFVSMSNNIYVDLNGPKKPNIYGRDFFNFSLTERGIVPGASHQTEEFIKQRCSKKNNYDAATCSARIIMYDNWQMTEDYPW